MSSFCVDLGLDGVNLGRIGTSVFAYVGVSFVFTLYSVKLIRGGKGLVSPVEGMQREIAIIRLCSR